MSAREVIAYAITHAPPGVKGGPYEGCGAIGGSTAHLGCALRWPDAGGRMWARDALASVRRSVPHARVIRIVRARPIEAVDWTNSKNTYPPGVCTMRSHLRTFGQEASAVEVLRELVADAPYISPEKLVKARSYLAASGPDPMPVVRAAMRETDAEEAFSAAPHCGRRGEAAALDAAARARVEAVGKFRKAGSK